MPALLVVWVLLYGGGKFLEGLAAVLETEIVRSWYFGTSKIAEAPAPPLLSQEIDPLFTQYQQHMDMLYQIDAILRSVS